jgi:uncharacterized protein (DUF58 family)
MAVANPLPGRSRRRPRAAIPLAGVGFRRQARRHAAVRLALAAALVGVLAWAFVLARSLPQAQSGVLPPGRSAVVVLDLSASIDPQENGAIFETLDRLSRTNDRYGLVLFSDQAYEAWPPGTPAGDLRALLRYYAPARTSGSNAPLTPWSYDFRAGTRISVGLDLALRMLRRDHVRKGGIVLVSDLVDAPLDTRLLEHSLLRMKDSGYAVRVVSLVPGSQDAHFFANVLGKQGKVGGASTLPEPVRHSRPRGSTPTRLVLVAALLLVLLAANEALCGRLTWREAPA